MTSPKPAPSVQLDQQALQKALAALARAAAELPELAGLAHQVRVQIAARVATCGIFRSGRLVLNSRWFSTLGTADAAFVVAHELMHLLLRTHERGARFDPKAFNWAHDAVINDHLAARLGRPAPEGAVIVAGARFLSAEHLIVRGLVSSTADDGDHDDVLADEREHEFDEKPPAVCHLGSVTGQRARAWSVSMKMEDRTLPRAVVEALAEELGTYAPEPLVHAAPDRALTAWHLALTRFSDAQESGGRSYATASRRFGTHTDFVMPGRRRRGARLDVLLDTSSSMTVHLPVALAAVQSFCAQANVNQVRFIETDGTSVSEVRRSCHQLGSLPVLSQGDQELYLPAEVCEGCGVRHAFRIEDAAPTALAGAFAHLRHDVEVEAVAVITDGFVSIPTFAVPFAVHWLLVDANPGFAPGFGQITSLTASPH